MAKTSNKGLVATKIGMSRILTQSGEAIPVTLLKINSQAVTKLLTKASNGYDGYQIGFAEKAEKNLSKADTHRLKKVGVKENFSKFLEFRTESTCELSLGATLTAKLLEGISFVHITGRARGRGFQGSVKRWGSAIGRMTHGSRFHRRPGSLGQCTSPGRVFKNKHQPGQMGNDVITVLNTKIVDINFEKNVIAVKGSVPGCRRSLVEIRESNRT
jgi:large subunit ribosomal protein L3